MTAYIVETGVNLCCICLTEQERAGRLVAGAMEALLPAVDANDEAKTLACFRFFCIVLSSLPRLEVMLCPKHLPPLAVCPVPQRLSEKPGGRPAQPHPRGAATPHHS